MTHYRQASSEEDIRQILTLQQKNLPKNLTAMQMQEQGFLTVEHSFKLAIPRFLVEL